MSKKRLLMKQPHKKSKYKHTMNMILYAQNNPELIEMSVNQLIRFFSIFLMHTHKSEAEF